MIDRWSRVVGQRERDALIPVLLGLVIFVVALAVYARTAAPSVMAGDSAEFQFAAPLLGVPHPTGYPLYIMLGKLATVFHPRDIAHRVTLVSAVAGAGAAALLALLALRITRSALAALIAAIALAASPGLWNAATMAEVYALNALLIVLLAWTLAQAHNVGFGIVQVRLSAGASEADRPQSTIQKSKIQSRTWLYAAAFVTGLGVSHHGSFAFIAAPLFVGYGLLPLWLAGWQQHIQGETHWIRDCLLPTAFCLLFGLLGLTPWLFILVQYARFGPFDGLDFGLPRAYFWGSPTSWVEALSHIDGGAMRAGVFHVPDGPELVATALTLARRLRFEFGMAGLLLGAIGCLGLLWRSPQIWFGTAWVAGITALYFACLTSAVQDAPVFTVPLLLPWALWVGMGAVTIADGRWTDRRSEQRPGQHSERVDQPTQQTLRRQYSLVIRRSFMLIFFLVLTLLWARSRLPYGNKADQWLFRSFGEGALAHVEPNAAVLTRWEQGTTLQYLRLIEGQRPDVTVDIVEPEDDPWPARARRRYAGRPIYVIGSAQDGASLHAQRVWGTDYATLFRLDH